MDKNIDRYEDIINKITRLNCSFSRIKAVDGTQMSNNEDCIKILKPRENLIGKTFKFITNNEEWIYDGTIEKSFPGLGSQYGTKGLTMSNMICFYESLKINAKWFCILEDDAEINIDNYNLILNFINDNKNSKVDIVLLDDRGNGWGGTAGMLYNKNIIMKLINDLHPLSDFSINSESNCPKNIEYWKANLWDWKLWKYLIQVNKNYKELPCIKSGKYPSTIG
jgi:hypothetical protein